MNEEDLKIAKKRIAELESENKNLRLDPLIFKIREQKNRIADLEAKLLVSENTNASSPSYEALVKTACGLNREKIELFDKWRAAEAKLTLMSDLEAKLLGSEAKLINSERECVLASRVVESCRFLMKFLNINAGENCEWPVQIVADEEEADELCEKLTRLEAQLKDYDASTKIEPWIINTCPGTIAPPEAIDHDGKKAAETQMQAKINALLRELEAARAVVEAARLYLHSRPIGSDWNLEAKFKAYDAATKANTGEK